MIATCAHCGKICNRCTIKRAKKTKDIDFCCYDHYLEFWRGTPGFVPFQKSQIKK